MIGGIGNSYAAYSYYGMNQSRADVVTPVSKVDPVTINREIDLGQLKKIEQAECETCQNRTYIDGSDEGNVSFKTPGHISPESSYAAVSAHEGEHVANAKAEGAKPGAELLSANVSLKTALCPECGRSYVAGGTTTTQIKYSNEANPYQQLQKKTDALLLAGMNVDYAA